MSEFDIHATMDGRKLAEEKLLDGQGLKGLIEAGMTWLKTNQQIVNSLNVFPVPDGDTGTNMVLTIQAAYNEISKSGEKRIGKMAHAIAQGALMGARGNSGVILSQLFRGFARSLDNLETMDASLLVKALIEARNTAYKGVVRPVEGTILTVAKDIAAAAEHTLSETDDMNILLERIVLAADESVKHTPELLPILKQAGVVDSGGKGLFFLFEGMNRYLKGLSLETATATIQPLSAMNLEDSMDSVEPGQDYEVVVDFRPTLPLDLESFYSDLSLIGTSIQVGEGDGMYRMHIHVPTEKRYEPIDYTMTLGTITKVSMENLVAQMAMTTSAQPKLQLANVEPGQIAVVAISPGAGQTMNPSTEEILQAIENLPTDKVVVLPDNKNIILAAQTAATMTVKRVAIVPSKSVPQGLSAMLRLDPEGEFDRTVREMSRALEDVQTCEVTTATRSVEINGVSVKQGEVIGLHNGQVVEASTNLEQTCLGLLEKVDTNDHERITFFFGDNIRTVYPKHEIELHDGGQPHYQFIISIE
jgi:DAK2 domain fusion protein YloV